MKKNFEKEEEAEVKKYRNGKTTNLKHLNYVSVQEPGEIGREIEEDSRLGAFQHDTSHKQHRQNHVGHCGSKVHHL